MAEMVVMPPLGEVMEEGTVQTWYKAEGDKVTKGELLVAIETDKATLDVEALASGILLKILVLEGETAPVGAVLAWIGEPGEPIRDGQG